MIKVNAKQAEKIKEDDEIAPNVITIDADHHCLKIWFVKN